MRNTVRIKTDKQNELVDITDKVRSVVESSGIRNGICAVYVQGATAAIMIQENWDESVPLDVVNCLGKLIPEGGWLHDQQDNNAAAHIKAGIVGPSETIPIIDGILGLSQWQGVFLCEFDGPRLERSIICTCLADSQDSD